MSAIQDARVMLTRVMGKLGKSGEIPYPDIATKEKAQQYIGLPMDQLRKEKEEFLKNVVPVWDQKASERENGWKVVILDKD
jgi:nitrite reductase (cytochrome c-552)